MCCLSERNILLDEGRCAIGAALYYAEREIKRHSVLDVRLFSLLDCLSQPTLMYIVCAKYVKNQMSHSLCFQ